MMQAQPFPAHAGMGPGHPGMPNHPMGMQHPGGGHMGGHPGPGMMQGMHPGVSGPQVTQGPMVTGMPPGAGTPAPGGPMHNGAMAMAHLGPQQPMFQQHNPQFNIGQMPLQQQQHLMRQQMLRQMQQQQQQHQQHGMPIGMPNGAPAFNQAQLQQMKMGMPMQQQLQMQAVNQQANFQQQQQQQHQRMLAQAAQQQAQLQAQQQQQQNQRAAAQQMQLSRSEERQTTQPPQSHPTPAPQNQPQPQSQPTPKPQPPAPQVQPQAQPQAPANQQQQQQQNQPTPTVKQSEPEEEPQVKQQDTSNAMMMQELPKQDFSGQCILQLIQYQDSLANPDRPHDLSYWEETIRNHFSPFGSIRQQFVNQRSGQDKSFQLQFPSLARFYHAHFTSGVKQILLQSYDHNQTPLANGGTHLWSQNATLTYVFANDIRVTTNGSLKVNFNDLNKIEHMYITTNSWQEYIPRSALQPVSPDQKQSPKINKNIKRAQGKPNGQENAPVIPTCGVGAYGVPEHIIQFLEIAEVMTVMGPLFEYHHTHPGIAPREALTRVVQDNHQFAQNANTARLQNQMARAANGQMMPGPGMMPPNQFQSPGMAHLNLPQGQGSPHIGGPVHTPSPAQNPGAGGVAMMHQMSAQGSNLSGSQGPSTNTSPNVSNKRRRPSAIKLEEESANQDGNGANKVKPSPRIGGKRQKGTA